MSQDVQHVSALLGLKDRVLTLGLVVLLLLGSDVTIAGDSNSEDDARELAFFEAKIRPMLVQHCYKCHSVGAGKAEGGLRLDSRTTIRAGGDRGPAIVPGDSEASLLLTAISHTDPDLRMPPKKERLPESVINDFKSWIRMGAADPREDEAVKGASPPVDIEAGRRFWSFQKPVAHQPPNTKNLAWTSKSTQ